MHFPVPPAGQSRDLPFRAKGSGIYSRDFDSLFACDTQRVFSSMEVERNFFGRLGTCRRVPAGGGSRRTRMGVWQRPFLEAILPKEQVRNVLYSNSAQEE